MCDYWLMYAMMIMISWQFLKMISTYKGCCDNFTKRPLLLQEIWSKNNEIFNVPRLRIDKYRCSDESYEYEPEYNNVQVLYDTTDTEEDFELQDDELMYANFRVFEIDGQKRIASLIHYLYDCSEDNVSNINEITIAKAKELCMSHFDRMRTPSAVLCASGATKEDATRIWTQYYQAHFRGIVKSMDFDPTLGRISIYVRNLNL